MGPVLSDRELVRLAGGAAYMVGVYRAQEELVGRLRVRGHVILGRVYDISRISRTARGTHRKRLRDLVKELMTITPTS